MIKRKKCNGCGEKIKNSANFCPNCGTRINNLEQDWGMLGKNDINLPFENSPILGGISGGMLNKMINHTMKMIEKELEKGANNQKTPGTKIKLMINGQEINPSQTKKQKNNGENEKRLPIEFSEENLKKWMKSKKQEPKASLKRIDDKIEYELEVPGVETIKDISIIKLEESFEVRAIAKEIAYQKNIPLNLPLKKYTLLRDKLTLELDASM